MAATARNKRRFSASNIKPNTKQRLATADGDEITDLQVSVTPWGSAFGMLSDKDKSSRLWQLQLRQGGPKAVTYQILAAARRVLQNYPADGVMDTRTLEEQQGIKLLNGAPPQGGPADPDGVGLEAWLSTVYCTGESPQDGLDFVKFLLKHRYDNGEIAAMPTCVLATRHPTWPFGDQPQGWSYQQLLADQHRPFSALPPRGKRHVMMQVEMASEEEDEYILCFWGNIYPYREAFDAKSLEGGRVDMEAGSEYVRSLKITNSDEDKERVANILENVLLSLPVYLINATGTSADELVHWLCEQDSVYLGEAS
ncbi:unnamed protein product [Symbiodinium sp. CCMP2592]|nr:unnamed protein product [Symbiodinium sp. CCMP2592]